MIYDELKTPTLAPRPFFTHIQMHRKMAATAPIRNTTPNTIPEMAVPLDKQNRPSAKTDTKMTLPYAALVLAMLSLANTNYLFHGRVNSIFAFVVFLWRRTTHAHIHLSLDESHPFVSQR